MSAKYRTGQRGLCLWQIDDYWPMGRVKILGPWTSSFICLMPLPAGFTVSPLPPDGVQGANSSVSRMVIWWSPPRSAQASVLQLENNIIWFLLSDLNICCFFAPRKHTSYRVVLCSWGVWCCVFSAVYQPLSSLLSEPICNICKIRVICVWLNHLLSCVHSLLPNFRSLQRRKTNTGSRSVSVFGTYRWLELYLQH